MIIAGDIYDRVAEYNKVFPQSQARSKRVNMSLAATVNAESTLVATDVGCFEEDVKIVIQKL